MTNILRKLSHDNSGATAIEYGLIVSLIVIAIIASMSGVADESTGLWTRISNGSAEAVGNTN